MWLIVSLFFVDEFHTALNKSLVNFLDLNRILKSEIFLYWDGQLRAVHVILGFMHISNHFQSPKNMIRAKGPRLALIVVAILEIFT